MFTKSTRKFFLYSVALTMLGVACTSEQTPPDPEPVLTAVGDERLLMASSMFYSIDSITYNADKTPQRLTIEGPGNSVTMTHSPVEVTHTFLKFGKAYAKRVYELENGVARKLTFCSVDADGKVTELATKKYVYKGGKLSKEVYSTADQSAQGYYIEYFYDSANENVKVMQVRDEAGVLLQKTTYEYSDIPDKSGFINQWTTDMDGTLFPRKSKYLKSKQTVEYRTSLVVSTYTYELDEQGYVVKGKRVSDEATERETIWTNIWQ